MKIGRNIHRFIKSHPTSISVGIGFGLSFSIIFEEASGLLTIVAPLFITLLILVIGYFFEGRNQ